MPIMSDFRATPWDATQVWQRDRWELIQRAHAFDNYLYCVVARNVNQGSAITAPWGDVLAYNDGDRDVIWADVDVDDWRRHPFGTSIPAVLWSMRRPVTYASLGDAFRAGGAGRPPALTSRRAPAGYRVLGSSCSSGTRARAGRLATNRQAAAVSSGCKAWATPPAASAPVACPAGVGQPGKQHRGADAVDPLLLTCAVGQADQAVFRRLVGHARDVRFLNGPGRDVDQQTTALGAHRREGRLGDVKGAARG